MLKFFLGIVVGVILVVLVGIIALVAMASFRNKPPTIAADSTLILRLNGELPERSPVEIPIGAFGQHAPITMEEVWGALRKAAADKRIKAVVVEPQGLEIGWARMQELHADLEQFRKSGKPLYAYLKTPGAREYYVATAASKIYMGPEDMLNLKGVRFELMYFKHTLDKLGVTVDVEHAGKYKDFGDMFTRADMSPETREVLTSVIDRVYGDLVKTIGVSRRKTSADVTEAIDNGPLLSQDVASRGLVDGLCYEDQMFGKLKQEIKGDVHKVGEHDYARGSNADAGVVTKERVGFVVAEGDIVRGDPESSDNADGIESESFTKLLAKVGGASDLKGVIVRIDSPGGEVFASDAIWRAMNELARKKPVVISMSDAAASGGYYIAMNGAPIVAYPETLTGSIGVVFGKPNLHGLYDKLGIDKAVLSRGRFAEIDSDYKPLDDAEKAKLRDGIDANYQAFLKKVADSRKRPVDQIEPVAQGRVWLGEQARENGLVDELGGIDKAIELVKKKASIPSADLVELVPYPARRSLFDLLFSSQGEMSLEDDLITGMRLRTPAAAALLKKSRVRAWLRGGYLSVCPWSLSVE